MKQRPAKTRSTHCNSERDQISKRNKGEAYETLAIAFLQEHGLQLLQRNFSCKLGEIDLIMRDSNTLVFVEVRFRKNNHFGSAVDTVTYRKQQKVIRAAQFYLLRHPKAQSLPCRFDVLGIEKPNDTPTYEWIRNAFCVA